MMMNKIKEKTQIPLIDVFGRITPQAVEFEEAVLGALMLEAKVFSNVDFLLSEDCFYKEEHRKIYLAIKELNQNAVPIDLLSVTKQLRSTGELEEVGGSFYIASLTNRIVTSANIEHHARILQEKAIARKLIAIGTEITREAFDETRDVLELVSKYNDALANIFVGKSLGVSTLREGLTNLMRNVANNKTDKKPSGMLTGFHYFDERSGGLQYSDLVVIAGETSMGKSSLALCIAKNIAESGTPVAFYSLEMSTMQLCARITSISSEVSANEILYHKLDDVKYSLISQGIAKIENLPIFIDDNGLTNIDGIISSIRYMTVKFGLKLAVIDYLQLANARGIGFNKEQEVSYMIQRLKNVAKELNICIVALSQLSRNNQNPYPTLSRLRDSGQIEQAADVVMFVYRPEYYGCSKKFPEPFAEKETNGYAMIDIAKGRNIGVFKFLTAFEARTTHFKDVWLDTIPIKAMETVKQVNKENLPF